MTARKAPRTTSRAKSPGRRGGEEEWGDEEEPEDDGQASSCTTADLEVGAVVHEAELEIEKGSAVFGKVELAG